MILEIALALTLYDIAWLSGDWQLTSGTRCVEEHTSDFERPYSQVMRTCALPSSTSMFTSSSVLRN